MSRLQRRLHVFAHPYTLLLVAAYLISTAFCYSIDLPAGREECFLLTVTEGTLCSGNFEVFEGRGAGPVHVKVMGPPPDHVVEYDSVSDMEGSFSFDAVASGDHFMCLSNPRSVAQTVGFNFRSGIAGENDVSTALLDAVDELARGLEDMRDHQEYMNQREDIHRQTLDSTKNRVFWWTIAEALVLVSLAFWQISYIHKFFEVKRRL